MRGDLGGADNRTGLFVVDDDPVLREMLAETTASWGLRVLTFESPTELLEDSRDSLSCDVLLLDIYFPNENGLEALPRIKKRFPGAKVIMMTGAADKETAIQALKFGAFDYIEKPFEHHILKHAVQRALEIREKEEEVFRLLEQLRDHEKKLLEQNRRLEYLNTELLKTNKAMAVLAQSMATERTEAERRMALQLRGILLPIVEKMAQDARVGPKVRELEIALQRIIDDLTTGQSMESAVVTALSTTELRVAFLIRNGFTTEEIARQLNVSPSTIKTHRRNIRKKLNIKDAAQELREALSATMNSS